MLEIDKWVSSAFVQLRSVWVWGIEVGKYDVVNEPSVAYGGTPEDEHSDQHSSSIYDNEDFCIKRPTVQCHLEEEQADKQN